MGSAADDMSSDGSGGGSGGDLLFRPLTLWESWTRSRRLLRQEWSLFMSIGFIIVGSLTAFCRIFLPIPFDIQYGEYMLLEVVVLALSSIIANGPIIVATAGIYSSSPNGRLSSPPSRGSSTTESSSSLSFDWSDCFGVYKDTHTWTIFGASLTAMIGVSLGSIIFYIPGIFLAIRWFFVPCVIVLEDNNNVESSGPRSSKQHQKESNNNSGSGRSTTQSITAALKRSWNLSKAGSCYLLMTLGIFTFLYTLSIGVLGVASSFMFSLTRDHIIFGRHLKIAYFVADFTFFVTSVIITVILLCLFIITKTVLYLNCRVQKENLTQRSFLVSCKHLPSSVISSATINARNDEEEEMQPLTTNASEVEVVMTTPSSSSASSSSSLLSATTTRSRGLSSPSPSSDNADSGMKIQVV